MQVGAYSRGEIMKRRIEVAILSAATGLILLSYAGESHAQSILAIGPDAEVTEDGLHRIDPSIMDAAWVKPDMDLSRYTRIFFMPAVTQFREIVERQYSARTIQHATEFPVSETAQTRLRELFGEVFYEIIEDVESYELTDELGREVLMVRGFLTDVISGVPPDIPGSAVNIVRWAWEANVVLELRDSMSGEVLARTVERLRLDGPMDATFVWVLTPRAIRSWSSLLALRLDELSDLYTSGSRLL